MTRKELARELGLPKRDLRMGWGEFWRWAHYLFPLSVELFLLRCLKEGKEVPGVPEWLWREVEVLRGMVGETGV